MHTPTRRLLSLVLSTACLYGTAHAESAPASKDAPAVAVPPAATPASTPPKPDETAPIKQYVVVAGDTLAKVAARKDVYGNPKLWPLLYRANNDIIGAQGLIYPGQVLTIARNYTPEDLKAMIERPKPATHVASAAKPAASTPASAPAAPAAVVASAPPASKPVTAPPAAAVTPPPASATPATPVQASPAAPAQAAPAAPVAARQAPAAPRPAEFVSAARRAFAAGDIPWALYYYNTYLASNSRDARAWGEIGNVYYLDGQLPESAQAYFNAANIMIDQGRSRAAAQLLPAIEEGNPILAQALYGRLLTLR